jgi:photoactive yellow protein
MEFSSTPHGDLQRLLADEIDALDFGVIGFDAQGIVQRYNRFESEAAGLSLDRVIGLHLFNVVAPCMNNYLVAQRFDDAVEQHKTLDAVIDYVLTLRMRPTRVQLRLLYQPGTDMRYVLVQRALR